MTEDERFELLVRTMLETRKNKRRGRDWVDFEYHWSSALSRMFDALNAKTFRVNRNYTFLTSYPKWREIFATSAEGRIADHLLCDILKPYIERELHSRTFNNREGMGAQAAINQVIDDICEVSQCYTRTAWVIKWDLKGFFPSANCNYMEDCFRRVIDKYRDEIVSDYDEDMPAFLEWLAMICIHCNPAGHCTRRTPRHFWAQHIEPQKSLFGKPPGIGVPIGRMSSQTGMGLYINDDVRWLNDELGIKTTVFMDDGVMVVPDERKQYALQHLPQLRSRLEAKGVRMNDKKFYCQQYWKGFEFLGSHVKPTRLIINNTTWSRCLQRIDEYNAMSARRKYEHLDRFLSTVNSYGGLLKSRTSYRRMCQLRDRIHDDWWQWLQWDERRQCAVCKPQHTFRARLNDKYHLKLKKK